MKKCSRCGVENGDEDNYCAACGWSLASTWKPQKVKAGAGVSPTSRIILGVLILLFLTGLAILFGTKGKGIQVTTSTQPPPNPTPEVTYEVVGKTSSVDVTYMDGSGSIQQYSQYRVPFKVSFAAYRGAILSLSAQKDQSNGYVTVNIYLDGDLFRTSTSRGPYVIASTSGRIP